MKVTPDSSHRIVLTKEIRDALNLRPGQSLDVSISAGAVFLSPVPLAKGKIVRKGKLKVYSGRIPNDVAAQLVESLPNQMSFEVAGPLL